MRSEKQADKPLVPNTIIPLKPLMKSAGAATIRFFNRMRWQLLSGEKQYAAGYQPLEASIIKDFNKVRPLGPQKMLCYAPFKMMYFAFNGEVIACCHNRRNILGRIPAQSIMEIWNGSEFQKLREHIANDDLSYGCEVCKNLLLSRNFDGAKNALYDRYAVTDWPQTMEFELDNTCNLACVICNENFSSGIAGHTTKTAGPYDESFVEQLIPFIPHLKEAKFYGGEPFLIPLYYRIWEQMLSLNPGMQMLIQTNGTVLNEKVKSLLEQGNFNINVSIDALDKTLFEQIRQKASFEKVMENTLYFSDYCRRKSTHFGIIPTPNRLNWQEIPRITAWAGELGARVYYNTLITPLDLALWNLPHEDLETIHRQLSETVCTERNVIERANGRHFRDFLVQIDAWRKDNASRVFSGKTKVNRLQIMESRDRMWNNLQRTGLQKDHFGEIQKKFDRAFESLKGKPDAGLIFLVLEKIPAGELLAALDTGSPDHLIMLAGKKYFEASGQYELTDARQ